MTMGIQVDVQGLMRAGLGEWLAGQEQMRAAAKDRAEWRWTWGAALLMPVIAFLWFADHWLSHYKIVLTGGGTILVWMWGYQPIAEAKKAIKVGINSAIARSFGIAYAHEVEPGAEFEAAKSYGLVPEFDRSAFEDLWHGTLEGHPFSLYEAHLEERRGSGRDTRWVTVFRGVIIRIAFGRDFRSTTLLQRADKHRKWFGLGGAKDSITLDGHRLDVVDQVHPAFAQVFGLWSDDQVEARTLVHPSYVEHLVGIEQALSGKNLRALFKLGELVLVVESDNLFESGAMDAATDHARAEEAAAQFTALAGLALAINQNDRGRVISTAPVIAPRAAEGFGRRRG